DQGRVGRLGAGERVADDRRLTEPDEAVLAQGGHRPDGAQGNRREPRSQEAGGQVGEGLGPELRQGPARSRHGASLGSRPRHHPGLHDAHAGEQGPHGLRQDDGTAELL
ncbi:MAG: hypothetical protein AVDCRST_MAG04-1005, partial [uncultured Acetobacteraceae bacterium]